MQISQKTSSISFALLGPPGTYSDLALLQYEKKHHLTCQKYYCSSIKALFAAVHNKKVERGIIPFENLIQGPVTETIRGLKNHPLKIIDKLSIDIQHALVTLPLHSQEDISLVASHSQALAQCSKYLTQYFPQMKTKNYPSTMAAMEKMLSSPALSMAVIIPQFVAENNPHVKILATNIQNQQINRTTFIIVRK